MFEPAPSLGSPSSTGSVEVPGSRLYFDEYGQGAPVILLHGATVDRRMWDSQVEPFSRHFRVIRYDRRGDGDSPRGTQPYSDYSDVGRLMDYLGIPKAHLVGLSAGGSIAVDFALANPERIETLVVVPGGIGGFEWSKELDEAITAIWAAGTSGDLEKAKQLMWESPPMVPAGSRAEVRKEIDLMLSAFKWPTDRDRAAAPRQSLQPPAIERLEEIQAPLLIVSGDRECDDFFELGKMMAARVLRAERVVVPGAGHMVSMENPEEFNRHVLAFLRRHAGHTSSAR